MKRWKTLMFAALTLLLFGGVAVNLVGCVNEAELAETQTQADDLATYFAKMRTEAMANGDTDTATYATSQIAKIEDAKAKAVSGINDDDDSIAAIAALGASIPFVGVVSGVLCKKWGKKRGYEYLTGVVAGLNKLREKDPAVAASMAQNKTLLHDAMGPETVKEVDKIRQEMA